MAATDVQLISPQELHHRLAQGDAMVVIDVRTRDALSVQPYKIPQARWIPLADVVQQAVTLPRHGIIVMY